jgi:hypothetical protein
MKGKHSLYNNNKKVNADKQALSYANTENQRFYKDKQNIRKLLTREKGD